MIEEKISRVTRAHKCIFFLVLRMNKKVFAHARIALGKPKKFIDI